MQWGNLSEVKAFLKTAEQAKCHPTYLCCPPPLTIHTRAHHPVTRFSLRLCNCGSKLTWDVDVTCLSPSGPSVNSDSGTFLFLLDTRSCMLQFLSWKFHCMLSSNFASSYSSENATYTQCNCMFYHHPEVPIVAVYLSK